jgi:hypothetical protein
MKRIFIMYWRPIKFENCPYNDGDAFEYSIEKRTEVINSILDAGFNIKTSSTDTGFHIWIDTGRFSTY